MNLCNVIKLWIKRYHIIEIFLKIKTLLLFYLSYHICLPYALEKCAISKYYTVRTKNGIKLGGFSVITSLIFNRFAPNFRAIWPNHFYMICMFWKASSLCTCDAIWPYAKLIKRWHLIALEVLCMYFITLLNFARKKKETYKVYRIDFYWFLEFLKMCTCNIPKAYNYTFKTLYECIINPW